MLRREAKTPARPSGYKVRSKIGRPGQHRIRRGARGAPNVLFGWMLAADANEAYRLECYLWHAQGGSWSSLEGNSHPQPADPIPFLGCPDCEE